MLGETYEELTKDLEDGAAELLNIIFGQAKVGLNEKGYKISKAIPTIIRGESLRMRHSSLQPTMKIPFTSAAGSFVIEIVVETRKSEE
jgi:CheY-specific phosphatase CheX